MNQELQEELKTKLEDTQAELQKEIEELSSPVDMGDDIDSYDEEADEAEEFSANMGAADSLKRRLSSVELALAKMAKGTYGTCASGDHQIEEEMLRVNPEAEHCKEHTDHDE